MTHTAEVTGIPEVELYGVTGFGNTAADVIVPTIIDGRPVPIMFQSGMNNVAELASPLDGYVSDATAWGSDALEEKFGEVDVSAAQAAAQDALDKALTETA